MASRILFLAPQPFYQDRGTPIAIDLALQALEEDGYEIDLVTYPEGEGRNYRRVCHHRVPKVPGVVGVAPGFSWKKLVYSFLMIFTAFRLALTRNYAVVHAVEESCFIALLLKGVCRIPYVYDMDSSIAQQLVEKKPSLRTLERVFSFCEGFAVRHSTAVVAVCPALVELARKYGARQVLLLRDISLLGRSDSTDAVTDLRAEMGSEEPLILYVGNLEHYQGVDILLEGFALARRSGVSANMAVIGGRPEDVARYKARAEGLGVAVEARFFGPRPVPHLGAYLAQADILASPRSHGNNTPMKIYTYLDAGKAILATRIASHTQALDDEVACLVEPTPEGVAEGIARLAASAEWRRQLGTAGRKRATERHSWPVYSEALTGFYRKVPAVSPPVSIDVASR